MVVPRTNEMASTTRSANLCQELWDGAAREDGATGLGYAGRTCSSLREVLKKLAHRTRARLRSITCIECARAIHCWNRRTSSDVPQRGLHVVCWRRRLRSQQYSVYLQAIAAEGEDSVTAACSRDMLSPALRELRQLRATAFAVHQRMERLEKNCRHLYDSAGISPPRAR
jgi:hypothetical protein